MTRRPTVAIIGSAGANENSAAYETSRAIGRLAIDNGYRIATGGLGGVMEAACRGAHESPNYREGDTLGILPQDNPHQANPWVDIVVCTGLGHARNALVANADSIIAVGGGAGTLSEIAFAWTFKRLVVAMDIPGWSAKLAGTRLDQRERYSDIADDQIFAATSPEAAIQLINDRLPDYARWGNEIRKCSPSTGDAN